MTYPHATVHLPRVLMYARNSFSLHRFICKHTRCYKITKPAEIIRLLPLYIHIII